MVSARQGRASPGEPRRSWRAALSHVEVHPHRLRLGEILDRGRAVFAAEAGIAHAAPRQPHVGIAIGVDPDRAGTGLLRKALHASDIPAPDAGSQAIGGTVGDPQRIGLVAELDHAHDWAEDFFLRDPHLVPDIGEHRGADEVAAVADALTAGRQKRAFLLADIDIVEDALHLLFGDDRAEGCGAVGGVADADRLRALRQPLDHLVIDSLMYKHARTGRTDLP